MKYACRKLLGDLGKFFLNIHMNPTKSIRKKKKKKAGCNEIHYGFCLEVGPTAVAAQWPRHCTAEPRPHCDGAHCDGGRIQDTPVYRAWGTCTPGGQNQFSLRHPLQLTMQFWDVKHHILIPSWSTPQNYLDVRTRVSNQKVSGLVWVQISTYFLVQFRFSSGTKIVRTSSYRFVTVCN